MRISNLLAVAFIVAPSLVAANASAREGARVVGVGAKERPSAAAGWTDVVGGRMHPGWQLSCPAGCALEIPGARLRLDETTTVRDLEAALAHMGAGRSEALSASIEVSEGGVTAEVLARVEPLLIKTPDGAQLLVHGSSTGRVVARSGRERLAAMEGTAEVGAPLSTWAKLAAGSFVTGHAGRLGAVRALPSAPTWPHRADGDLAAIPSAGDAAGKAAWAPEPSAVAYRFEIARDAAFTHLVRAGETPFASVQEPLPMGRYFVRVRAIDADALESAVSGTRTLRVLSARPKAADYRATR